MTIDAISRDKAIVQLSHLQSDWDDDWNVAIRKCIETIKIVPSVTPQTKMGQWIKQTLSVKPFGEDTVLCDQCAFMTDKDNIYNYCPNCGAKMQEVK